MVPPAAFFSHRGRHPQRPASAPRLRLLPLVLALSLGACDQQSSGPSVREALEQKAPDVPADYKATPKPRPQDLPPPTDAEFAAWNRKDPEGEKHLYKWDKANGQRMLEYWEQLQCFREAVVAEGTKAFGAEPGSPAEEQWYQYKRAYVVFVDGWQKRLFAEEPRILEKSKFIGNILEAHEHVMHNYPKAFNDGDKTELEKVDAQWTIVEQKVKKYAKSLGIEWVERDLTDPKQAEAHKKVCDFVFTPPDRSGKEKKRTKKKGSI
jgi:hypothetical protein